MMRTAGICLYKPEKEELWFREAMLADPETMSYNDRWGGVIAFPKERWDSWAKRWLDDERTHVYRYIREETGGCFAGEAAFHFDPARQIWLTDVVVHAPFRRQGYGKEALRLLLAEARRRGLEELYDDLVYDNPAIAMFAACGFEEICRNGDIVTLRILL